MSIHTAACNAQISELLSDPAGSVEHQMGEWFQAHTDREGREQCIEVIAEEFPDPRPVEVVRRMWPLLRDRAVTTPAGQVLS